VSSTEAIQRAAAPTRYVELPMALATASTLDPSVGKECRKVDLDTTVGEDVRSLDLKAARILMEVMAAMCEVNRLWEVLPMALRVLATLRTL
jgi:hypothetical protein